MRLLAHGATRMGPFTQRESESKPNTVLQTAFRG
jgi:hypothetical protein